MEEDIFYSIIEFNDGSVSFVPCSWLVNNKTKCYWPNTKNEKYINSKREKRCYPEKNWDIFNVKRILGNAKTLKAAKNKEEKYQYKSNLSSDDSSPIRKKNINNPYVKIYNPRNQIRSQKARKPDFHEVSPSPSRSPSKSVSKQRESHIIRRPFDEISNTINRSRSRSPIVEAPISFSRPRELQKTQKTSFNEISYANLRSPSPSLTQCTCGSEKKLDDLEKKINELNDKQEQIIQAMQSLAHGVEQSCVSILAEVKSIKQTLPSVDWKFSIDDDEVMKFPVRSISDFIFFEKKLKEKEFFLKMVSISIFNLNTI